MAPLYLSLREAPSPAVETTAAYVEARQWRAEVIKIGTDERYPIEIRDPWEASEESGLEWYLQDYPRLPLLKRSDAAFVSKRLKEYGRNLADQLKACPFLRGYSGELILSILAQTGVCPLQRLHWELLEDAQFWGESHRFRKITVLRSVYASNPDAPFMGASGKKGSQKHRILFVVTRRTADGKAIDNIDSTLVTQPAFAQIKKKKYLAEGEILRPPTWKAFEELLMSRPMGYYDVVHFDMHGHVDETEQRAYLEFQSESSNAIESVSAINVATLLVERGVDTANLNACESAKQLPSVEANLAYLFADWGVPCTVGMAFNILDNSAEIFESVWYEEYFSHFNPIEATRRGRQALAQNRQRKGAFRSNLDMDDYFVPCLYRSIAMATPGSDNASSSLSSTVLRGVSKAAASPFLAYTKAKISIRSRRPPEVAKQAEVETIVGRASAVTEIEKKISRPDENVLFIVGPGGSGKTALLDHLRSWWKTTGFVEESYTFSLHHKGAPQFLWTLINFIQLELVGPFKSKAKEFDDAQDEVVRILREKRLLLILDDADFPISLDVPTNTVSILNHRIIPSDKVEEYAYGTHGFAIFLEALVGGKSKILLASRQVPMWVNDAFQENNHYTLPPVADHDVTRLCDKILSKSRSSLSDGRQSKLISQVPRYLDYNPLALETVLPLAVESHTKHPDLLNKLWAGELQPKASWLGLRKEPRFVDFLRKSCEGENQHEDPVVSLFWISEFVKAPPADDNAVFWIWIFAFSTGQLDDAKQLVDTLDVVPAIPGLPPGTELPTLLEVFRQTLGTEEKYGELMSQLFRADILIDKGGDTELQFHPLFSHVARNAKFGVKDEKKLAMLLYMRRQATWRYTLWSMANMVNSNRTEGRNEWDKIVPKVVDRFPDIVSALELACHPDMISDTVFATLGQADMLTMAFLVLDVTCGVNEHLRTPYAEVRRKFLDRCLKLEAAWSHSELFFNFTCNHANALAGLAMPSLQCELADSPEVYISLAQSICSKFRKTSGERSKEILPSQERRARQMGALLNIELGKFESARQHLETLLGEEPELADLGVRESLILPVLTMWLMLLASNKGGFPTNHELLVSGKTLKSIIVSHGVRTEDQLKKMCPSAQKMLDSTYYDLQKPSQAFSLPPRGKKFDAQYQRVYADAGAAWRIAASVAINAENYGEEDHKKAMRKLTWAMKQQNLGSSSSGGGAMHDRISHYKLCEMALAQAEWAEAVSHLTLFTGGEPSRLPAVHLIYTLCFAKLRMCDAARGHLIYALELAEKSNDTTMIPPICGALAGLEFGKRGHYSVLPKLLLLRGLSILYASGNETASHIENRRGAFFGFLLHIVGIENVPMELGIDPRSVPQFGKSYEPLTEWEDSLNNFLTIVDQETDAKLSNKHGFGGYDGGSYRRELNKETENIIFLDEKPAEVKYYIYSSWTSLFLEEPEKATFWDIFGPEDLKQPLLNTLLEIKKSKAGTDLVWDVDEDKIYLYSWELEDDSSSSDDDEEAGERSDKIAWDRSRCFHEHFIEELLVPAQARMDDEARAATVQMLGAVRENMANLANMDNEGKRVFAHGLVEEMLAKT